MLRMSAHKAFQEIRDRCLTKTFSGKHAGKGMSNTQKAERVSPLEQTVRPDCCEYCNDGDGGCVYPMYGVAPHHHDLSGGIIGSTVIDPCESWPANFTEDPEEPGCGVYTHCLHCGAGS